MSGIVGLCCFEKAKKACVKRVDKSQKLKMKHVWVRPQHQKQSGPVVSFVTDKMALWEARCVISSSFSAYPCCYTAVTPHSRFARPTQFAC